MARVIVIEARSLAFLAETAMLTLLQAVDRDGKRVSAGPFSAQPLGAGADKLAVVAAVKGMLTALSGCVVLSSDDKLEEG